MKSRIKNDDLDAFVNILKILLKLTMKFVPDRPERKSTGEPQVSVIMRVIEVEALFTHHRIEVIVYNPYIKHNIEWASDWPRSAQIGDDDGATADWLMQSAAMGSTDYYDKDWPLYEAAFRQFVSLQNLNLPPFLRPVEAEMLWNAVGKGTKGILNIKLGGRVKHSWLMGNDSGKLIETPGGEAE